MSRRPLLPLLCLLAWAPLAQAFPPCPQEPVTLISTDDTDAVFSPDAPQWARGWYTAFGAPPLTNDPESGDDPDTGKCRDHDDVPVPQMATPGDGSLGVVALPDTRYLEGRITVRYTLDFEVDTLPLASAGDSLDLAQLEFETSDAPGLSYPETLTTAYRVRKRQPAGGAPVLEVLEMQPIANPPPGQPGMGGQVVATIPMPATTPTKAIHLRWTQQPLEPVDSGTGEVILFAAPVGPDPLPVIGPVGGLEIDPPVSTAPGTARSVDSDIEVIDDKGDTLYRVSLPLQWASTLSMGLLDHHLANRTLYTGPRIARLSGMSLRAEAE